MYRSGLFLLVFALGAAPALAAPKQECVKVSDIKSKLKSSDRLEILGAGAFHMAEGIWMATPPLSPTTPYVDGALLLTMKGDKNGVLIFIRNKEDCSPIPPFPIPAQWVRMLSSAKTSSGESVDPTDGEELHL